MQSSALLKPRIIDVQTLSPVHARVVMEPFERGYGHTLGLGIGYGYVRWAEGLDRNWLLAGSYELEVASERLPCKLQLDPLHDPKMARIKA